MQARMRLHQITKITLEAKNPQTQTMQAQMRSPQITNTELELKGHQTQIKQVLVISCLTTSSP